jgi:hypothetical protein
LCPCLFVRLCLNEAASLLLVGIVVIVLVGLIVVLVEVYEARVGVICVAGLADKGIFLVVHVKEVALDVKALSRLTKHLEELVGMEFVDFYTVVIVGDNYADLLIGAGGGVFIVIVYISVLNSKNSSSSPDFR